VMAAAEAWWAEAVRRARAAVEGMVREGEWASAEAAKREAEVTAAEMKNERVARGEAETRARDEEARARDAEVAAAGAEREGEVLRAEAALLVA